MCCVMGYTGHDLSAAKFKEYLLRTVMRGPDDQRVVEGPFGLMGFGRLAIMGLTPEGMQPFYRGADCVVCNGELYGFRFEKEILKRRGYKFQSDCDCEILLPLYYEYGLDMFRHMDSEFALIMYDSRKDRLIAARDPIGIRPLFYGYSKSSHKIAFASEMQNLIGWCDDIRPFPIGSYYCDGRFVRYEDIADVPAPMQDDMDTILTNIREKLIAGVEKRLDADAPVGFLLSGGLDSSLVCSIAAKKLGKSRSAVTNSLRLLALPEDVRRMVSGGKLSFGHAKVLLGLPNEDLMRQAAAEVTAQNLNVRQTEALCKKLAKPAKPPKEKDNFTRPKRAVEVEAALKEVTGSEVHVDYKDGKGSLKIDFYSDDMLQKFVSLLGMYDPEG